MKKLVSLLLVLCLVLGVCSAALAAGAPKIQKQPTSQTTDKNGKVTLSFKATNFNSNESSWRFINPVTGDEYTGPELRDLLADVKGFKLTASNQKQTITLEKVPESMNGWEVYVHLVNNGYEIDTDHFRLWCYGMEQVVPTATPEFTSVPTPEPTPVPTPESTPEPTPVVTPEPTPEPTPMPTPEPTPEPVSAPEPESPKMITVTAVGLTLCPVDDSGNLLENEASSVLTFEESGNVAVRSDIPVQYWIVNGIRIVPMDSVTGFVLMNVSSDLNISAEAVQNSSDSIVAEPEQIPAAEAETEPEQIPAPEAETDPEQFPAPEAEPEQNPLPPADTEAAQSSVPETEAEPETLCQITCTGCVFTYHAGGLRSVTSGSVPKGAAVIVSSSGEAAGASGYSINGGDPEHVGSTSFRLIIEGDTDISIP